jgi:quercetin dioxygenase-like cupin family protein
MRDEILHGTVIRWEDLPEDSPRNGIRRRGYATDALQMMLNLCDRDIELRPHSHSDRDQLVIISKGRARYHVDGVAHEMTAGSMMLVRAGSEHYIEPLEDGVENIDIFVPPREDLMALCPLPESPA